MSNELVIQLNTLLAALILLTSFALLVQRRMFALLHIFAWQGFFLGLSTAIIGFATGVHHLYLSSLLTLGMKVILLPYILYKLILKLKIHREIESVVNVPTTMMIGIALVIFSYHLTEPVRQLSALMTRTTLAVALATVMLGLLMMVTRRQPDNRLSGHGKRPLLCRHQRHLWHADGGGAGGGAGPLDRRVHLRHLLF